MARRDPARWLEGALLFLGLAFTGWALRSRGEALAFQTEASTHLDSVLVGTDSTLAGEGRVAHPAPPDSSGRVIGRIEIPRLGISAMIAEGTENEVLDIAVGHVRRTAHPGERGNVALAGHRDSFFRGLGEIRENDIVRIVTPERTYSYEVKWGQVFEPRRVDVLDGGRERELTLITCYPFTFVGHAPKRFIVRAQQIDPVPPTGVARVGGRRARAEASR